MKTVKIKVSARPGGGKRYDIFVNGVLVEGGFFTSTNNLIAVVDGPDNHNEANARLIAAAPDMLEALRKIADCALVSPQALLTIINDQARAAIAKAEGK